MHTEEQYALLNNMAKEARLAIKGMGIKKSKKKDAPKISTKEDGDAFNNALRPFSEKVQLLGFSHTDLLVQIGRINNILKDRRCD